MKKKTKLERLRELRRYANLESFTGHCIEPENILDDVKKSGRSMGEAVSDFVREYTKGYRNSWVTPIVDEMIEAEVRAKFKKAERDLLKRETGLPKNAKFIYEHKRGSEMVRLEDPAEAIEAFGLRGERVYISLRNASGSAIIQGIGGNLRIAIG